MDTWIWIVIVIVALLAGVALGFFIARRYMMKYLQDNPPINEEMLRIMMMQMGQKPSERKVKQIMASMKAQSKASNKKTKK